MDTKELNWKYMGEQIKQERMNKKFTVDVLSELSGINRQTIYDLESGRSKNCTVKVLFSLADALDYPVYMLITALEHIDGI